MKSKAWVFATDEFRATDEFHDRPGKLQTLEESI